MNKSNNEVKMSPYFVSVEADPASIMDSQELGWQLLFEAVIHLKEKVMQRRAEKEQAESLPGKREQQEGGAL